MLAFRVYYVLSVDLDYSYQPTAAVLRHYSRTCSVNDDNFSREIDFWRVIITAFGDHCTTPLYP